MCVCVQMHLSGRKHHHQLLFEIGQIHWKMLALKTVFWQDNKSAFHFYQKVLTNILSRCTVVLLRCLFFTHQSYFKQ